MNKSKVATIKNEHSVHINEHWKEINIFNYINWDDIPIFLEISKGNSFRQAAAKIGCSVNMVRARVDRLEAALGVLLFIRTHKGVTLTAEGFKTLELALEMQTATARLTFGTGNNALVRHGELRICCTEGIGEFWLTPRIGELQDRLPNHMVVLQNDFDQKRINTSGFDLCISFERPAEPGTIVTRLGSLHFMMYASETYIRKFGEPASMDDAAKHRVVVQSAPGLLHEAQSLFVGQATSSKMATAKVNTSYSLFRAIANGVGVGALPTYISTLSQQVRPLDLPVRLKFDLWLSFDQSARKSVPVRAAIDWLRDCFDVARYPWFGDSFIHPAEFARLRAFWETGTAMGERAGIYDLDSDSR